MSGTEAVVGDGPEPSSSPGPSRRGAPFLPDAWWRMPVTRRRQVAGLVLVTLLAMALLLATGGADDPAPSGGGGQSAAAFVADLPPQRVSTWNELAECESTDDWSADTGNGFYGGLQFTLDSWETVDGEGNPADASRDEQIMRAEMLQQLQGWKAWPVCSRTLGLTD